MRNLKLKNNGKKKWYEKEDEAVTIKKNWWEPDPPAIETPDYSKIHPKDGPEGRGGLGPEGKLKVPDHRKKNMQKTVDKVNANSDGAGNVLNQAKGVEAKDKKKVIPVATELQEEKAKKDLLQQQYLQKRKDQGIWTPPS